MSELNLAAAHEAFAQEDWSEWTERYLEYVRRVQGATHKEWVTPEFQAYLWEHDGLMGVGSGSSVVVRTAYEDSAVVECLWRIRGLKPEGEVLARSRQLDAAFKEVMALVFPKHNARRPKVKLVRIFAAMFPQDVLPLDNHRTFLLRAALGLKRLKQGDIGNQVRVSEFLRQRLGVERVSLAPGEVLSDHEVVRRCLFAWYLVEKVIQVDEEDDSGGGDPGTSSSLLKLRPFERQRKGLSWGKDTIPLLHAILQRAEHGATASEIVEDVQSEAPTLSQSSRRSFLSHVRSLLGLLELRDGALRPTERGSQVLEGEDLVDVLGPLLIIRVYGFAQLLDKLRSASEGLPKRDVILHLQAGYPSWTSARAPSGLISWALGIGLIERWTPESEGVTWLRLTPEGMSLADRTPLDLSAWTPQPDEEDDDEEESDDAALPPAARLDVPKLDKISNHEAFKDLVLPAEFLAHFHGALHALEHKRFVLLTGLSGTGKTSIARAYARAYCQQSRVRFEQQYLEVPVRPDWTDPGGLLGYFNPLASPPVFQSTDALNLLREASIHPSRPYFLCLDEMNLARVEYYFAPFLSAMEKGESLAIHAEADSVDGVPPRIPWPRNLFVIGTVNMDETTHAFSDKVLDRAFSFELWDVALDRWAAGVRAGASPQHVTALEVVLPVLEAAYAALHPARRHFGYRTCDEVLRFVAAVAGSDHTSVLDTAVFTKILPKIRGDDTGSLPTALDALHKVCVEHKFTRSASKLQSMRETLADQGVVRFWA